MDLQISTLVYMHYLLVLASRSKLVRRVATWTTIVEVE